MNMNCKVATLDICDITLQYKCTESACCMHCTTLHACKNAKLDWNPFKAADKWTPLRRETHKYSANNIKNVNNVCQAEKKRKKLNNPFTYLFFKHSLIIYVSIVCLCKKKVKSLSGQHMLQIQQFCFCLLPGAAKKRRIVFDQQYLKN